jgi:hypothetical protein
MIYLLLCLLKLDNDGGTLALLVAPLASRDLHVIRVDSIILDSVLALGTALLLLGHCVGEWRLRRAPGKKHDAGKKKHKKKNVRNMCIWCRKKLAIFSSSSNFGSFALRDLYLNFIAEISDIFVLRVLS